jgi:Trk K+ transport system NAD-binding subunit
MSTAIMGIGQIGGTVARELASGGESVVLSAVDTEGVKKLASEIGGQATAAPSNRDAG